jgi:hypothetical protein
VAFGRKNGASGDDFARAKNAVNRFWGVSNGADGDLTATAECLGECLLGKKDINELRAELPIGATGTTGMRVSRIDRVLKRLEYEA